MLELLERGEEGGAFETTGFRNGYDRILTVFLARYTAFELLHAVEIDVVEEILPQMLVEHLRQFGRRTVYHGGKVRNTQVRVGIGFVVFHAVFDFFVQSLIFILVHSRFFIHGLHFGFLCFLPFLFLFFLLFSYGSSGGDFQVHGMFTYQKIPEAYAFVFESLGIPCEKYEQDGQQGFYIENEGRAYRNPPGCGGLFVSGQSDFQGMAP